MKHIQLLLTTICFLNSIYSSFNGNFTPTSSNSTSGAVNYLQQKNYLPRAISFHEAGHFFASYLVGLLSPAAYILPKNKNGLTGICLPKKISSPNDYIKKMAIAMAGISTEFIFSQNPKLATWKQAKNEYNLKDGDAANARFCTHLIIEHKLKEIVSKNRGISIKSAYINLFLSLGISCEQALKDFNLILLKQKLSSSKNELIKFISLFDDYEIKAFSVIEELVYQWLIKILSTPENKNLISNLANQLEEKGFLDEEILKKILKNPKNIDLNSINLSDIFPLPQKITPKL